MSRPLVPRPAVEGPNITGVHAAQRPKKISTACGACKARKTRCSGGTPCDACASRNSGCIYDAASDQRRKVANQRNLQDLEACQTDLEACQSDLDRHRELLGGLIATIRAGDFQANDDLVQLIQRGVDLSQLAAHVRNECRSNLAIQRAYDMINFVIDGGEELPSPTMILGSNPIPDPAALTQAPAPLAHSLTNSHPLPNHDTEDTNMYGMGPTL